MNVKIAYHAILSLLILLLSLGCGKDDPVISSSLEGYIAENAQWLPHNQLVACAAGGQEGFLDDPEAPLSMFFYPKIIFNQF